MLNGTSSNEQDVSSGVPQGSILGPLLFLISVNSICDLSFSLNTIISLFADDIILYKEIRCDLDLVAFQADVNLVVEWVNDVHLRLNNTKMKAMMITRKRNPPLLALTIDGKLIENVKSFKYLGVILTCDLKWNDHINAVCAKARKLLGFLYRTVRGGDCRTLTYLFISLDRSTSARLLLLCLGHPTQGPNPPDRTCSGFCSSSGHWALGGRLEDFVRRSGLVLHGPEEDSREYPNVQEDIIREFYHRSPQMYSKRSHAFVAHACLNIITSYTFLLQLRTVQHQQSFFIRSANLWNSLTPELVDTNSDALFKRRLSDHLSLC